MKTHARRLLLAAITVPVFGLVLAGCTQTVDPKSAENVIKTQIGKLNPNITATSVSCPDGVKKKSGVSFNCKASLKNTSNNATANATITLHITNNGNTAQFFPSDVHIG